MDGPQSGDLHLVVRQTFSSLSEEHPDLCSQQNIPKSYSNRLYRDNDGISQKGKSGLSHRILALLFLALDLRTEREGILKKKCNSLLKTSPLFLFWFYKQAQGEERTHCPVFYTPIRTLPQDFSSEPFSGKCLFLCCNSFLSEGGMNSQKPLCSTTILGQWKTFLHSSGLCDADCTALSEYSSLLPSLSALIYSIFTFTR